MSSSGNRQSGDGGSVQEFSHYDFINAPQFVDFADLARNDDPNADVFFETHREEDDFLIPIDNISPTIQLLNSNEQNILSSSQNKVNKAVAQAGMDDVKVVYYSSPSANGENRGTALSASGGIKSGSLNSSVISTNSFYTPIGGSGGCDYADKENYAPSPTESQCSTPTFGDETMTCKKLSYSGSDDGKGVECKEESNVEVKPPKQSLLAQLDKLSILSSDEETSEPEANNSYISPNPTPAKSDENFVDSILKTPGAVHQQSKKLSDDSIASIKNKLGLFEGISLDDSVEEQETTKADVKSESAAVDKDELFYKNEFPTFPGPSADDRKQSFLVDPTIGQEVVWNNDDPVSSMNGEPTLARTISNCSSIRSLNDDDDVNHHYYGSDADDTLTSSFDGYKDYSALIDPERLENKAQNLRRASSLSDLTKLQQMAKLLVNKPIPKKFKTALTMPHSPEASKRPTKCKSTIAPPVAGCSSAIATPYEGGVSKTQCSTSRIPKSSARYQPKPTGSKLCAVPDKPAFGVQRVPLKANHYISLAESIIKFQKNTPDRFRTLPTRCGVPIKRSVSCDLKSGERVRSKSPDPIANSKPGSGPSRSRTSSASSTGGSISSRKFPTSNSTSTNQAKFASLPKRTTIPQPFKFSVTRPRSAVETKEDIPDANFKARPAPKIKAVASGSGLIKDRPIAKVTQAVGPHFASDDRIRERNEKKAQSAQHSPVRFTRPTSTHPLRSNRNTNCGTSGARPQTVELATRTATTFKPFSFDQRDQETLRRKEAKIKQELEEANKVKEFHANPLPSFTPKLPKKKAVPITHVQPFHLKSDERGEIYQEALKLKLEEEERRFKETATFHANPPVVLSKPAFEPEHPTRPPVEHREFQLSTEQRAVEREQFDSHLKQKEMEEEAKKLEEQERQAELLKQEEVEQRRQLVHKAKPFRQSKAFQLKATEKALTVPHSPAFLPLPSQRRH